MSAQQPAWLCWDCDRWYLVSEYGVTAEGRCRFCDGEVTHLLVALPPSVEQRVRRQFCSTCGGPCVYKGQHP